MRHYTIGILLFLLITFTIVPANATLYDRGNGMIYDSDLNITWLQKPKNTYMTWYEAKTWAESLSFTIDGTLLTGWRLPAMSPVNGYAYNWSYSSDGSTDIAHNISAPESKYPGSAASEMAHLFYATLEDKGLYDVNGNMQSGSGLVNKGLFPDLQDSWYWSNTSYGPTADWACYFGFVHGLQWAGPKNETRFAIAVRDGDVPDAHAIPEPGTVAFLVVGLLGCVGLKKKLQT